MDAVQNVGIVIVNWNCSDDTIATACKLAAWGFRTAIVDNGSDVSGEVQKLRAGLPTDAILLERSTNGGFGAGMNTGLIALRNLGYEFAIMLNPDVSPEHRLFRSLLSCLGAEIDVLGVSQATEVDGFEPIPYQSAARMLRAKPVPLAVDDGVGLVEVDVVTGACIVVRLSLAESVNYIDETFFHYKEEFDFVYRLKSAGARVFFLSNETLLHRSGSSLSGKSNQARYYHYRNELLFLTKNFGYRELLRMPGLYRAACLEVLSRRNMSHFRALLLAFSHGLKGRGGRYSLNQSGKR